MAILTTLRSYAVGLWGSLDEFFEGVRVRETGAIGALGLALGAEPSEQKELGEYKAGQGLLLSVAGELRLPKGPRLLAVRALLEAGLDAEALGQLFLAGGDLVTDPRLGGFAKKLAEQGLPAALLVKDDPASKVGDEAETFARAAHAASSVLGAPKVKEFLSGVKSHAGASAALFCLGSELSAPERALWQKRLNERCAAFKRAPAAAKRMGLVAPWPPYLPEAFAPLLRAAEEASAQVTTTDALARPRHGLGAPIPPSEKPGAKASPGPAGFGAPGVSSSPTASSAPAAPLRTGATTTQLGTRTLLPALNRPPERRPSTSSLMEGSPEKLPPRNMPAVLARPSAAAQASAAAAQRASSPGSVGEAMGPKVKALATASRLPPSVLAALAARQSIVLPDGSIYAGKAPLEFDPSGKRIPHPHRWNEAVQGTEWPEPVLPAPTLKAAGRAVVADGPFAQRLKSLFDDRPEAVDRLSAAAEAREGVVGEPGLLAELTREVSLPRWQKSRLPREQLQKLRALALDANATQACRRAAEALVAHFDRER